MSQKAKIAASPLVFYDVDGTLAPPFATPPSRFKTFLFSLNTKGVRQILCSGKNGEYLAGLARGLGLNAFPWVIAENGGVLYNWQKLKKEYLLSKKEREAVKYYRSQIENRYSRWIIFEEPKETVVTFYFRRSPSLFAELKTLKNKEEKVKFILHHDGGFDVLIIGINKKRAVERFFEKIGAGEAIICGDGENDLDMFEAGFPVTFKDAASKVKKRVKSLGGFISSKSAPWGIIEAFSFIKNKNIFSLPEGSFDFRPWGKWEVLDERVGFKVKYLEVKPGHRLSLQRHFHRKEVWVVVQGQALVYKGKQKKLLKEGEVIKIAQKEWHRLKNPGSKTLKIVEIQQGEYLEEDDIERKEDDYGRTK